MPTKKYEPSSIIIHCKTGNGTSIEKQQIQGQVDPQWTQWQSVNSRHDAGAS
jgi:hypothetical protein